MPSWEARKLKNVVLSEDRANVFAQLESTRASPVLKVCKVKGGRGEVIDELSFVGSIAKIGDVVRMRHIRFSDQMNMRSSFIHHGAQRVNDLMSFWQVNAGCADFLPQVRNGIKADKRRAAFNVHEQNIEYFK